MTLTGITTPSQCGPRGYGNLGVIFILEISGTEASPSVG